MEPHAPNNTHLYLYFINDTSAQHPRTRSRSRSDHRLPLVLAN
jgi:hypothetical protein